MALMRWRQADVQEQREVGILVTLVAGVALAGCSRTRDRAVHPTPSLSAEQNVPVAAPLFSDSAEDGTPDFLRLDTEQDQAAFRRWFTFLAEVQYFNPPGKRPPEIVDCSSLLRYCYREALRLHDSRWASQAHLPLVPAFESIKKYNYPHTPLNAELFRVRSGPFKRSDLGDGSFAQFANAETLQRFNTFRVSRDIHRAQPGDLFFFRRVDGRDTISFHSMIFLGHSRIQPSPVDYVVYDTGPDGATSGVIKLLSIHDLLQFPDPQWRPYPTNSQFLGVFRWNILRNSA
jgi:uncharacterized protein YfaT (DUF1175 family)